MHLKKAKNKKTGRTYLSIVQSYRDKESQTSRAKTIESLGYLDELEKEYDDPIAYFEEKIKEMNQQKEAEKFAMTFRIRSDERLVPGTAGRKNIGYAALSKIYHELGIHIFLINRQRHTKRDYDANSIMKLLVFARLLFPGSKKKTYENKDVFFEKTDFSLDDDVYRCLSFFNKHRDALQLWLHERIKERYDTSRRISSSASSRSSWRGCWNVA